MIGIFSKDMQRTNIGLKDCYIKEEQSKWNLMILK
jgi:hypothetical protein